MFAALLALAAATAVVPPAVDTLTVTIHTEDADRFAKLFDATDGKPTAEQLQRDYLDPASYGVSVFTPHRLENAAHLAAAIAKDPAAYREAIDRCLPVVRDANAELRAIYLALHGLFPTRQLPQIYVVFGAGNSGGTAGPGAQVLGLEVLCKISPDTAALRATLRQFFAHETVHTLQTDVDNKGAQPLLSAILIEGGADYVAGLVTGAPPNAERADWAAPREAELWRQFEADLVATNGFDWESAKKDSPGLAAMHRWIANYQNAPAGWPSEMGYWLGMRIWQRYVDAAPDKHQALEDVLTWTDEQAILAKGRYRAATLPATQQMR